MKILVVYASAGAGHQKAAEAVYERIKKYTDHEVIITDVLDYTSPSFKMMYRGAYFFLISKVSWLWAFSFYLLHRRWLQPLIRFARRIYNALNARPFEEFLQTHQFDYIVSTHFMPNEVISALKRRGRLTTKLLSVVTDYDVHRIWLADGVNQYAVACPTTELRIKQLGVASEKVVLTGIPTAEAFACTYDVSVLRERFGLKPDMFTVLVATGSFGIGPIEEMIAAVENVQIIVACGHNQNLFQRLKSKNYPHVVPMALVDFMHELMAAADVMVTKPGGLSISEALVSQLPMIFFHPIPGQEKHNINVLREYNIGTSDCSIHEIVAAVNRFKNSAEVFSSAVKQTALLARPSAAKDIVACLL